MKKITILTLFVLTLAIFFQHASALKTEAIEYGGVGGRPANADSSWFIYNLEPGEQIEDAVLVRSSSNVESDVIIYSADRVRSSSGGFALRQMAEEKVSVGAWVKFYPNPIPNQFASSFTEKGESIIDFCALELKGSEEWCKGVEVVETSLEAKGEKEIPFVFSVPADTEIGEHTGGILIQKAKKDTGDAQTTGMSLTTRIGLRIYQTVPGDILRQLEIESFAVTKKYDEFERYNIFSDKKPKPDRYTVTTKVTNLGNVSTYFNQTITIVDELFDNQSEEITDRRFQALRDDTFHSNYSWENPRFGKFTFHTLITYEDEDGKTQELEVDPITIWIFPIREIALSAAIIFLLLIANFVRVKMYQKKYGGKGWLEYTAKSSDNLDKLAQEYNVNWKVFAKTNDLKSPYTIKAGDKLLVPPKK